MVGVIQLANMGLNNIMFVILTRLDGLQYYSLQAVLVSLGSATMTPIGGRLGDMFGRRNVILAGTVVFIISFAVMSTLSNMYVFMAGRLLFGLRDRKSAKVNT